MSVFIHYGSHDIWCDFKDVRAVAILSRVKLHS